MELKFFTLAPTLTFTLYLIICTVTTPGAVGAMVTSPGSHSSSTAMDEITHHGHDGRASSATNPITNLPITPAAILAAAKPASSNLFKKPMLPGFQQVRNMLKVYVCMYVCIYVV